jgi:penicillin G amidase
MLLVILGGVIVFLVAAAVAATIVVRRRVLLSSLPRVKGRLDAPGISSPVTVARDRFGVPHIDAARMEDAAYAMGLVHAQDRLWQLDFNRRVALGRMSELVGAEGIGVDRLVRRVGLHRVAEEEEHTLGAQERRMLDAYAAGVNSVIASDRPLPLEFRLLRTRPQPWEPLHSIACAKVLALGLSLNWDNERQRVRLLRELGPEVAARLEFVYPDANPTILANTARHVSGARDEETEEMFREASRWLPSRGGASNSWVVAGSRTVSGRPLLCNDPHLTPSVPSIWYAAHIRAGSDFESAGVTMPGLPFVLIGHNRRIAWGFTNSFADCQDLVIEEFDSAAALRYRTERGFEPARLVREIIRVKDASDEIEEVVITRHGPIVERIDDPAHSHWRGLALQWTALAPGTSMAALLALQRAEDWQAFRSALNALDAPSQNAVYADDDGHIGYFLAGRIPRRRRRASGVPVCGWAGGARWDRFLSEHEVPQQLDPPEALIVTANNRIVGDDFPFYIGSDYMNGYRALRIRELLAERSALDSATMQRVQMDVLSPPAREVAHLLEATTCTAPAAEKARQLLAAWDGEMSPDRIEPTIYESFMRRLAEHALRPLAGDLWGVASGDHLKHEVFGYPGNLAGRATPWLIERWETDDPALLEEDTSWDDLVQRALLDALGDLRAAYGSRRRWRWGRVHALPLVHPFSRRRPLGLLFNAGTVRVGGSLDTIMATSYVPDTTFATQLFAPSWRQVMDVGNWDECSGVHYPGQSGQPGSKHRRDLTRRWRENRQYPIFWSQEAVSRNAKRRLTLFPSPAAESVHAEATAAAA